MYLLHHEEIESLAKNIPGGNADPLLYDLRTELSDSYEMSGNVGMLRTDPVNFRGQKIVPIQFLKELLPDPALPWPKNRGQDQHRLHFHRCEGRQREKYLHL